MDNIVPVFWLDPQPVIADFMARRRAESWAMDSYGGDPFDDFRRTKWSRSVDFRTKPASQEGSTLYVSEMSVNGMLYAAIITIH